MNNLYTIGRHGIAILGGYDFWHILKPDGEELCVITGARETAEALVYLLNQSRIANKEAS